MQDLVCLSHLRWDFVWQRPQHLMSRMSSQFRVFFVEEPVASTEAAEPFLDHYVWKGADEATVHVVRLVYPADSPRWIGHGDPQTQPVYAELLTRFLTSQGVTSPQVWLYTPMASAFLETLNPKRVIYDVMDQLSAFKGAPASLAALDREVLRRADLVFTGGISLYHDKAPFARSIHAFPSGVEVEHFRRAARGRGLTRPDDLPKMTSPVVGYYGVIDERMDFDLIDSMARKHPQWHIVLVGPMVKIDPAGVPQGPNIHYTGMRTYEQLPSYLSCFDVALIPFALNEATRYLSPTKTLEYLAARKPVVSTPIRDVMELYGSVVRIGQNHTYFMNQVDAALSHMPTPEQRRREDRLLHQYSWDVIAERMMRLMGCRIQPSKSRIIELATDYAPAKVRGQAQGGY
jgi:UDP-galactopyranose mutase